MHIGFSSLIDCALPPVHSGGWLCNTHGDSIIRWLNKKIQINAVADGLPGIYPRLWRFCLVLTANRAAADDLAQSTCERALIQADKFEAGTDLDRWLFTMARRIWLNDIRRAKVRQGQGVVSIETTDIADVSPSIETNILAHQVLDKIQGLPEGQRLCVLLVYVEGQSYREAAEMLEIPIGTVMSRLSTARQTISAVLSDVGARG